ncbi:MAG: hypothetical protein M9950_11135 [Thermomicrobiales bacterium]|nr:hypothetical protein [Thermomicrobiales bacterium]
MSHRTVPSSRSWWEVSVGPGSDHRFQVAAAGAIASIARKPDHVDVFWVALIADVLLSWWEQGCWLVCFPYGIAGPGSAIPTTLGVCSKVPGHIRCLLGCTMVRWIELVESDGWHAPFAVTGPGIAAGGLSAFARTPEHVDVYYVTPDSGAIDNSWWERGGRLGPASQHLRLRRG